MARKSSQREEDEAIGLVLFVAVGWLWTQIAALDWHWQIVLGVSMSTLMLLGAWLFITGMRARRRRKLRAQALDELTATDFEKRIAVLLHDLGWPKAEHVGRSGDGGVDVRAVDPQGRDVVVQCKAWKSRRIGPEPVERLLGTRINQRADRAILAVTGSFTDGARKAAKPERIELWDGTTIAQYILDAEARQTPNLIARQRQRRRRILLGTLLVPLLAAGWAVIAQGGIPRFMKQSTPATVAQAPSSATPPQPPVATVTGTPVSTCGQATIAGVTRLVLRTAPGLQSATLADYAAGTRVELQCDALVAADGLQWQRVRVGEIEGWMSARMLQR